MKGKSVNLFRGGYSISKSKMSIKETGRNRIRYAAKSKISCITVVSSFWFSGRETEERVKACQGACCFEE